jgi:hypothetical protein
MAIGDEKRPMYVRLHEDTVSVGTTCLAQDDSMPSPPISSGLDEEVGEENANINTWKTASFWDDRQIPETSGMTARHASQSQEIPVWTAVPAVPVPMVPVIARNFDMMPAHREAQLLQQAKGLQMQAAQLEAEAWKLKNSVANHTLTTVMLRNIPNNITRAELSDRFVCSGFADSFDFLYLPMDFKRDANLGYAFVNLVSAQEANRFFEFFQGFDDWGLASHKVCEVCWGNPLQGFDQHIDRYRNSPVMHNSVPDEHKPILLLNGHRIPFPAPTSSIPFPVARGQRISARTGYQ